MDILIVYPDGADQPGVEIPVANGFVSRCVGVIADYNIPDAQQAAKILNAAAMPAPSDLEREERAHGETIDQRDAAESALSEAYLIVTGRPAEWSNRFGYREALDDIRDAMPTPQPGEAEVERQIVAWLRSVADRYASSSLPEAWPISIRSVAGAIARGEHRAQEPTARELGDG